MRRVTQGPARWPILHFHFKIEVASHNATCIYSSGAWVMLRAFMLCIRRSASRLAESLAFLDTFCFLVYVRACQCLSRPLSAFVDEKGGLVLTALTDHYSSPCIVCAWAVS